MPWLAQNSCASEERLLGMEHFQATTAEMRLNVNKVCEKMSSVLRVVQASHFCPELV